MNWSEIVFGDMSFLQGVGALCNCRCRVEVSLCPTFQCFAFSCLLQFNLAGAFQ